MISSVQGQNLISTYNERVYHQSNLVGDWKGNWSNNRQAVEFKVVNIRGNQAQVEYMHNGRTEKGIGSVQGNTITFGNVTIGTKNGSKAALEFSFGSAKMTAVLDKAAATPTSQNNLVGTWTISPKATGHAVTFQVISVSGRDAQVKYTVDGRVSQGTGTVYKNTIMFDGAQVSSDDGKSGKLTFQNAHRTFSIATAKVIPKTAQSSVNRIA